MRRPINNQEILIVLNGPDEMVATYSSKIDNEIQELCPFCSDYVSSVSKTYIFWIKSGFGTDVNLYL